MVRETSLTLSDLIYPLFVVEGRDRREVIAKVMALPEADLQNEGQVLQSNISGCVAVRLACSEPSRGFVAGLTPCPHSTH
jgi:delta-aminolevulinic acid dehydratase/porphobilinogen synthase